MAQGKPMDEAAFGNTAKDYAESRAGFPDTLYPRLHAFGVGLPGQDLVDIGTGTGTLARGFAARGLNVTGVDMDNEMLVQARRLAIEEGLKVDFRQGMAEETGLAEETCDVVTAGQCWHWFDGRKAIAEVRRILRPGGRLVIAHFDWLPLEGNVVEETERLILEFCPEWRGAGGMGLYPYWLKQLGEAGVSEIESFSYDVLTPYTKLAWRGRIQASAGIASLVAQKREAFDEALAVLLETCPNKDDLLIPHRVFALIAVI